MKNIAVIVAGGSSSRCGFDKLFTNKFGVPVIEQALSVFDQSKSIDEIVVVLSAKNFGEGELLRKKFNKITKILLGGEKRYFSVKNAIEYLTAQENKNIRVIVHNGANNNLKLSDLENGLSLAEEKKNVIFGYFTPNSIKKVVDDQVVSFLNRDEIFETQTPQISDLETFIRAIKQNSSFPRFFKEGDTGGVCKKFNLPRDEAELLNLIGEKIFVYECDVINKKTTYASDFKLDKNMRIGTGIDSHSFTKVFDKNKPVILGGVEFPECERTFDANSDGDVILHSLCNALLSTIGGKTLDSFADRMCKEGITDSSKYLEKAFQIIKEKYPNFKIINAVFSLEGKYPKLASRHDDVSMNIEKLLKISLEKIGLNYTTGENLTSFGRGKGVYCLCNILVQLS